MAANKLTHMFKTNAVLAVLFQGFTVGPEFFWSETKFWIWINVKATCLERPRLITLSMNMSKKKREEWNSLPENLRLCFVFFSTNFSWEKRWINPYRINRYQEITLNNAVPIPFSVSQTPFSSQQRYRSKKNKCIWWNEIDTLVWRLISELNLVQRKMRILSRSKGLWPTTGYP